MSLWKQLAVECASWCHTSALRDCKTVAQRVDHEGLSFLTITLPQFGKGLEKALDRGCVDPSDFSGFHFSQGLPRFLGGFLDLVFDRASGTLLDNPSIDAISSIRQLTLLFGKILLPCSDAREKRAMQDYLQCEQDVRMNDMRLSESDYSDFRRMANMLFGDMFSFLDQKVFDWDMVPKHGPGVTADKLLGNQKYRQTTWPSRLQEYFPREQFLVANSNFWSELDSVDILEPGDEIPVKVISVPKTLKTPRIIAVEPTAMQYAQQSLMEMFVDYIQEDDFLKKVIGFDNQTPNQRMAAKGSRNGKLATLDLSEASDRVSNELVRNMLLDYPHLHGAVDACRSRKARVLDKTVRLSKFASMGSALTFPIEAMVFTTMIFLGIERELNVPLDPAKVPTFAGKVRVYGDDLIVPVDYVEAVVHVLSSFGSKVNMGKSFWTGKFRESCGKEYYDGHDVSIVRVRHKFPTQRQDATAVISLVSLRNQLYLRGYWRTCKWLDEEIRKVIRHFPVVLPSSPVHGRTSFLGFATERIGPWYHDPQVRGYVTSTRLPHNEADGHSALLKYFLKRGEEPSADREHLVRSGRPSAVDIKLRWASSI